jgi:hypothetical protein
MTGRLMMSSDCKRSRINDNAAKWKVERKRRNQIQDSQHKLNKKTQKRLHLWSAILR